VGGVDIQSLISAVAMNYKLIGPETEGRQVRCRPRFNQSKRLVAMLVAFAAIMPGAFVVVPMMVAIVVALVGGNHAAHH
jgi:hypothetical protein